MKKNIKHISIIILLFSSTFFYAQTKSVGIGYQAVINKPDVKSYPGVPVLTSPLSNTNICLRFTFLDEYKIMEYQETINVTTDEFGIVNTFIGTGKQTDGYAASFDAISWKTVDKTLIVELDITGFCSTFEEISNQAFSSTPFAYNALLAANVTGIVDVVNGGTGADTVQGARTNLGLGNVDNTSDLNKPISTATQLALDGKLDKVLKNPESIVTSGTNTLSIKGLEKSNSDQNQLVAINPVTGLLSMTSLQTSVEENVIDYKAYEGQNLFTTPIVITNSNKVNVYRNGIRINATVVDPNTIKLEAGVICYQNDEIKIIQYN
jgi:hypothetical protein